jgi:hypothetical protein
VELKSLLARAEEAYSAGELRRSGGRLRGRRARRGRFRAPAADSFDEDVARDEAELVRLSGRRGEASSGGAKRRPELGLARRARRERGEESQGE